MAGTTIIMSKLKHIIRLRSNGVPLQTIAKASGLSRNTVKKYLRLIEVKKLVYEDSLQMEDTVLDTLINDWLRCLVILIKNCRVPVSIVGYYGGNIDCCIRMDIATPSSVITTGNGKKLWQVVFARHMIRVKKCLSITPVKSSK